MSRRGRQERICVLLREKRGLQLEAVLSEIYHLLFEKWLHRGSWQKKL